MEEFSPEDRAYELIDFYQPGKCFGRIRKQLLEEFEPKDPLGERNEEMLARIRESAGAVCVHVRRGDYLCYQLSGRFPVQSAEFFHGAGKIFEEKVQNPHFFVFSDDIGWARENLHFESPYTFVDINSEEESWKDIVLMMNCKHFLTSVSTFSWWAAWLGQDPNKIVIIPAKWPFLGKNLKLFFDEDWIQISESGEIVDDSQRSQ
ncbi:MAG: alpha-1,2-fucosyltransferase [Puniceicoccales bacterium]|nr:alpha-1,2-fucosyltransferase [Puniceicoccales bacterium]